MINIYCLPRNHHPFYVGATVLTLKARVHNHVSEINNYTGRQRSEKQLFLMKMKEEGLRPIPMLLRQVDINEVDFYEFYYYQMFVDNGFKMYQLPPKKDYQKKNTSYIY